MRLAQIRLHPIKSLDAVVVTESRIGPAGGLELDGIWGLYSADGQWINGKRTPAINQIRATFSPSLNSVTLSSLADELDLPPREVAFPSDTAAAAKWFSAYFKQHVEV